MSKKQLAQLLHIYTVLEDLSQRGGGCSVRLIAVCLPSLIQ